jgi:hypothetical protein
VDGTDGGGVAHPDAAAATTAATSAKTAFMERS